MHQLVTWMDHYGVRIDMVLGTILILIVASIAIFYIDRFLRGLLFGSRVWIRFSYETILFITRLMATAMWIGVGMLLLSFWGVSMTGLWTVLVSVTAIIGVGFLAVWTIVSNITASVFLTIWRPFYMGTTVEILPENLKGRAIDRNMMFTVLREKEGGTLYIPNNLFFQKIFRVTEVNHRHLFEFFEHNNLGTKQAESKIRDLIANFRG